VPDGGSSTGCQLLLVLKIELLDNRNIDRAPWFEDWTTMVPEVRITAQKVENKGMSEKVFAQILSEVSGLAKTASDLAVLQNFIVEIIPERLPYYNWTGFYMLDPDDSQTLVLGPFRGAPTEHVRIPVNQGICGAAVAQNSTVVVDDVHSDPRYLACSLEARSEIVVLIRANDAVVGEIDIDSHDLAAFSPQDREFLEKCAIIVGGFMERTQTLSSGAK
jgi:L-methionine (R)-S-oxide reductase